MSKEPTREQLAKELEVLRPQVAELKRTLADRTRLEHVLRAIEKGLETMQLGVTITDVDGRIMFTNPVEARIHRRTVDELIGKDVGIYAPEGYRKPLNVEDLKDLRSWKRESLNVRKDGSVFPVLLRSDLVRNESGEPTGVVTTCEDISELRQAEDALRQSEADYSALVEHATYGIYRSSVEGKFLAVNTALITMLGYESRAELMAVDLAEHVYADPEELARVTDQCRESSTVEGIELEWRHKDGSPIAVRLSGRAVSDETGEPERFEFIVEDVTTRRVLENQLRQSQKMEAIGQLTGGVAHDFNNILQVIQGHVDLMAQDLPREAKALRGELRAMQDEARRGAELVKKLMAFSRREELFTESLDLVEVTTQLAGTLRRLLPEHIEIQVHAPETGNTVLADRNAVEQIVVNLATNARDAMPNGGLLRIETRRAWLDEEHRSTYGWGEPGAYVCVTVSDTGVGMDESTKQRVFEPFFTTKPVGEGTGLGMAMIYGLVKQHNGFIHVYSEPEQGTTVRIYFPLAPGETDLAAEEYVVQEPRGGTETILVVEDQLHVRNLTKRLLEGVGYEVLVAADGEEGLQIFRAHQSDIALVLSDVILPKLTGPELHRTVRAETGPVRFMFMSGYTGRDLRARVQLDHRMPFIDKPWMATDLLMRVREVLDHEPEDYQEVTE